MKDHKPEITASPLYFVNNARNHRTTNEAKPQTLEEKLRENTVNNPFNFIYNETDVIKLVDILIENFPLHFKNEPPTNSGAITERKLTCARRALLYAVTYYVHAVPHPADRNLLSVIKLINCTPPAAT